MFMKMRSMSWAGEDTQDEVVKGKARYFRQKTVWKKHQKS
jgi:hypothetical protein